LTLTFCALKKVEILTLYGNRNVEGMQRMQIW
jgi:hypothetical protein